MGNEGFVSMTFGRIREGIGAVNKKHKKYNEGKGVYANRKVDEGV